MARAATKQSFFPSKYPQTEDRMSLVENKIKTLPPLQAQTKNQKAYLKKLKSKRHDILFVTGPAGTGKTYMAVRDAIEQFQRGDITKIVVTRPNVATGDDLGYLPGSLFEKMAPWCRPIIDVFMEHYSAHEVQRLIQSEELELAPLAYMRGRTFKNSLVIVDEAQNCTVEQMKMVLTRIGENSRMIITGDTEQWDRREIGSDSGLIDITRRLAARDRDEPTLPGFITEGAATPVNQRWERIGLVQFGKSDVVRHAVIEEVLDLYAA